MSNEERLGSARLGYWLAGLVGIFMLGQALVAEANGLDEQQGAGLIAGIVSKMVEPSGGLEPVGGVKVKVEKEVWEEAEENGVGEPTLVAVPELTVETDEDGCYVIKGVPVGSYKLSVEAEALKRGEQWVWVERVRSAVLDFILVKQYEDGVGTIKGTVIAGEGAERVGQPIAGAAIDVHPPAPLQGQSFSTLTDSEGRFSLNVPSGFQEVSMWAQGYESGLKAVEVEANRTVTVNFVPVPMQEEFYEGD